MLVDEEAVMNAQEVVDLTEYMAEGMVPGLMPWQATPGRSPGSATPGRLMSPSQLLSPTSMSPFNDSIQFSPIAGGIASPGGNYRYILSKMSDGMMHESLNDSTLNY